ncbi:MAG TPA: choice-of-anchor Q domain-containing protein, partial [Rhodanobacteraceae bacterium]|nr:choice-of-anchor Q domain-containing protein [Rhodanobacteraceae bacterium]
LQLPNDTGHDCPNLDLLADNGGLTLTHGLAPDSAAIDQGAADPNLTIDQRLAPRVNDTHPDIGAVEWKQEDKRERLLTSGFDGICDQ